MLYITKKKMKKQIVLLLIFNFSVLFCYSQDKKIEYGIIHAL